MRGIAMCLAISVVVIGCSTTTPANLNLETPPESVDYGDFSSTTLTTKAWQALADKDYPALFAYGRECIRRYGEKGKQMNAEMTGFATSDKAAEKWALNDVGTSLFIMGTAYAELKMYREAAQAFETLADDYGYAQCWDPKGWYWRPAEGARDKAQRYQALS